MKTYPLNQQGVDDFLNDLYSSSVQVQINEQDMIRLCLSTWLQYRFILNDEEVEYLLGLDEDFKRDLAYQIAYVINYRRPIILDRETEGRPTPQLNGDSVKVTAYEASQKRTSIAEEDFPIPDDSIFIASADARLIIRIYYEPR